MNEKTIVTLGLMVVTIVAMFIVQHAGPSLGLLIYLVVAYWDYEWDK